MNMYPYEDDYDTCVGEDHKFKDRVKLGVSPSTSVENWDATKKKKMEVMFNCHNIKSGTGLVTVWQFWVGYGFAWAEYSLEEAFIRYPLDKWEWIMIEDE
jgi:hypothetical protein